MRRRFAFLAIRLSMALKINGRISAHHTLLSFTFLLKRLIFLAAQFIAPIRFQGKRTSRLDGNSTVNPTATLAVHCGNVFDVGFSTYQSARLIRYNGVSLAWGP
jgi:hypothetical protein